MDGVISDASGRQDLLRGADRDWDRFFAAASGDALSADAAELLGILGAGGLQIVVLTARPVTIRQLTVDWLEQHRIPYDLLVMRPASDRGSSRGYKQAALDDLRAFGFTPRIAFEDDARNVEMFRARGVPCIYIHSGYYD